MIRFDRREGIPQAYVEYFISVGGGYYATLLSYYDHGHRNKGQDNYYKNHTIVTYLIDYTVKYILLRNKINKEIGETYISVLLIIVNQKIFILFYT